MKKPFLFFTLKCGIILYFAACTGIDHLTAVKSASPLMTKGNWKLALSGKSVKSDPNALAGYYFRFNNNGVITASKNGKIYTGSWFEDNISKRICFHFNNLDPTLENLNCDWEIIRITNTDVGLKNNKVNEPDKLDMTNI
jgi:hypothetical protein